VPENIPLADRELTAAGDQHAFERWGSWWDLYFALVLVTTLVVVGRYGGSAAHRAVAMAALLAEAVLYAAVGRRLVRSGDCGRLVSVFLIGLVGLFVLAESQDPVSAWALFALIPQCFMAAPLRLAIPCALALNLAPVVFLADPARRDGPAMQVLVIAIIGAASSVAFGTWVHRIIAQSAERAELIGRLEAAQAELAEVSRRAGTLAERQRLAGEIHDTLAQGLTSIVMLLQTAEPKIATDPDEASRHVGLATQTAREGLAEARAMVAALTPTHLEAGTLDEALRRLTDRIGAELAIGATFEVRGQARPLPAAVEVALLRVGQEALANVRKHAAAKNVHVALCYGGQATRLDVTDDGAGFDPAQMNGGYGLRGMRGRILAAGGSFGVRARPGAGTALSVEVPG
jgi:signal transduction histidine kinase